MIGSAIEVTPAEMTAALDLLSEYGGNIEAIRKDIEAGQKRRTAQEIVLFRDNKIITQDEARSLAIGAPLLPRGQVAVPRDLLYEVADVLEGEGDFKLANHVRNLVR